MDPTGGFGRVVATDVASSSRDAVIRALVDVTTCRNWLAGVEVACQSRLTQLATDDPAIDPDAEIARATQRSRPASRRVSRRAPAVRDAPSLGRRLELGELSGEHVDAFVVASAGLPAALRHHLAKCHERLADHGCQLTPEEFREFLRREAERIEADDGRSRLQRQRAATRLRTWTDRNTGMVHLSGCFDPAAGLLLSSSLAAALEAMFHAAHPPDTPDDPLERQHFLRAHALLAFLRGGGARSGAPEFVIVIDEETYLHGRHSASRVDCGHWLELPIDELRDLAGRARFVPVVINGAGARRNETLTVERGGDDRRVIMTTGPPAHRDRHRPASTGIDRHRPASARGSAAARELAERG